jgi:hypothetical protein
MVISDVPDSYSLLDILNDSCIYLQIKEVYQADSKSTYDLVVMDRI